LEAREKRNHCEALFLTVKVRFSMFYSIKLKRYNGKTEPISSLLASRNELCDIEKSLVRSG